MLAPDRRRALEALDLHLTRSQADALAAFEALLRDEGSSRGVVARGDVDRLFERHIADSLRAVGGVERDDTAAYDLGSGGGLPGIPIAIALPDLRVSLVERRANRASFLRSVVEALDLSNARVVPSPIEELDAAADVCFARALAPLPRSWALARRLLRPGGRLVYFAGSRFDPAAAGRVSAGAPVRILRHAAVASGGPLVIMGRP